MLCLLHVRLWPLSELAVSSPGSQSLSEPLEITPVLYCLSSNWRPFVSELSSHGIDQMPAKLMTLPLATTVL